MGCPKRVLNGPCGGMKLDGTCELGNARCIFAEKWPSEIILDQGFKFRPTIEQRHPSTKLLSRIWDEAVWIAEIPPSFEVAEKIQLLKDLSMTALSVPDNPLAILHLDSSVFAAYLKRLLGYELVVHFTCRDLNRLAIKSRLLSLHLNGVEHILALTGDHPSIRPGIESYPTPVFDLDSVRMIYLTRLMSDYGVDELGKPVSRKLEIYIGAGLNPHLPLDVEFSRVLRKIRAGAEFFITQLILKTEQIENLLRILSKSRIIVPVFVGFPLTSGKRAREVLKAIGLSAVEIQANLESLAESYLEALKELRKIYGPVGAFISTLGRLENFKIWDEVFRSLI